MFHNLVFIPYKVIKVLQCIGIHNSNEASMRFQWVLIKHLDSCVFSVFGWFELKNCSRLVNSVPIFKNFLSLSTFLGSQNTLLLRRKTNVRKIHCKTCIVHKTLAFGLHGCPFWAQFWKNFKFFFTVMHRLPFGMDSKKFFSKIPNFQNFRFFSP